MDDFWIGMMMRVIRRNQEMFWITAASSISLESCIMELSALMAQKKKDGINMPKACACSD